MLDSWVLWYETRVSIIWRACFLLLVFAVFSSTLSAQQGLAPSVQADLLRDKIYAQAKANNPDGVLASLDEYHKLVSDNNLTFPVPLYWIEAKAAHDAGDAKRALDALGQFLNSTEHNSEQYKQGLALYSSYEREAAGTKRLELDARRAALRAKIPWVISDMEANLVEISGGELSTASDGPRFSVHSQRALHQPFVRRVNVRTFSFLNRDVKRVWWEVFAADTGREPYLDFQDFDVVKNRYPATMEESFDIQAGDKKYSYADITAFAAWTSSRSSRTWRFPSEAEIEVLARRDAAHKLPQGIHVPTSDESYRHYLLVGDCWHLSGNGSPSDGTTWQTSCDDPRLVVLRLNLTELQRGSEWNDLYSIDREPADFGAEWAKAGYFTFRLVRE